MRERQQVLSSSGLVLAFTCRALDEDISVDGLLRGLPSGEQRRVVQRWSQKRRRPANPALAAGEPRAQGSIEVAENALARLAAERPR